MMRLLPEKSLRKTVIDPFVPIATSLRVWAGAPIPSPRFGLATFAEEMFAVKVSHSLLLRMVHATWTVPLPVDAVGPDMGPGMRTPPGSSTVPVGLTRAP